MLQELNYPTYPAIQLLINSIFPSETWHISLLASGSASVAWEVQSTKHQFVIRAMSQDSPQSTRYAEELAILAHLYHKGLSVPRPIASSEGHLKFDIGEINFDWAITEKARGQAIRNQEISLQLAQQIGAFLAILHAIPVRGYGHLEFTDRGFSASRQTPLAGAKQRWHNYPMWGIHEHVQLETTVIATMFPEYINRLKTVEKQIRASASEGEPVICHGDLHGGHIFVENDALASIIDFGDVAVLPAAWDFAIVAYYSGWEVTGKILDAYTSSKPKRKQLLKQTHYLALIVGVFKLQRQFVRHASVVVRARTLQFIKYTLDGLNQRS